jgi:hypothetical protein
VDPIHAPARSGLESPEEMLLRKLSFLVAAIVIVASGGIAVAEGRLSGTTHSTRRRRR